MSMTDSDTGFFARLADVLDGIHGHLASAAADRARAAKKAPIPVDYVATQSVTTPAGGGNAHIGVGGPDQGHVWLIRQLAIGSVPITTALTGASAYVYATPLPGAALVALLPLSDLMTYTATLPRTGHWSNRQMIVRFPQKLHFVLVGVAASTVMGVEAHLMDYEQGAFDEVFAL